MRIHTDLTMAQMRALPRPSGVGMYRLTEHGSRSRTRGFDMILEGTSAYGGQFGNQDYSAGTWDEWGDVLGELFAADPCARITGVYEGASDYHWATGDRFHPGTPHNLCKRHKWESVGPYNRHAIEWEHWCTRKDCTAIKRYHRFRIGDQNPGGNPELRSRPVTIFVPDTIPDRTAELHAARRAERTRPQVTYPRVNADGVTVWACCESSIGPTCAHRREIVEVEVINPLGKYASDGAYLRDLRDNPGGRDDLLARIDDLLED